MLRTRIGVAMLAASFCALAAAACSDDDDDPAGPQQENFTVTMNGANERPNPVTTTATGTATLSFTGSGPISFTINVTGLSSLPVAAHIHGPASTNAAADVIVGFTPITSLLTGVLSTGTISATGVATISMDSLKVLLRNGNAYINVHTANFTGGEIRGQIND